MTRSACHPFDLCLQAEFLTKAPDTGEELSELDSPVKKPAADKKGKKGAQPAKVLCVRDWNFELSNL